MVHWASPTEVNAKVMFSMDLLWSIQFFKFFMCPRLSMSFPQVLAEIPGQRRVHLRGWGPLRSPWVQNKTTREGLQWTLKVGCAFEELWQLWTLNDSGSKLWGINTNCCQGSKNLKASGRAALSWPTKLLLRQRCAKRSRSCEGDGDPGQDWITLDQNSNFPRKTMVDVIVISKRSVFPTALCSTWSYLPSLHRPCFTFWPLYIYISTPFFSYLCQFHGRRLIR